MMDAWKFKTLHDSTFEATDVVHKLTDVLYVSTVAGASIFIRPIVVRDRVGNDKINCYIYIYTLSAYVVFCNCNVGSKPSSDCS
jgi:hypothetical protein